MGPVTVTATWDPEARVWVAESADLPGLILEAATQEELQEKVFQVVPELIADTAAFAGRPEIPVRVVSETTRMVHVVAV